MPVREVVVQRQAFITQRRCVRDDMRGDMRDDLGDDMRDAMVGNRPEVPMVPPLAGVAARCMR